MVIHEEIWDAFMDRFVAGAAALKVGDPLDPTTDLGPMVDATAAGRTQRWVDEAVALGGKLLLGGKADGTFFPPTVLTDVPLTAQVCSNEAFAPLVVAFPFRDLDEAIAQVNDSMFGLQTGVFTNDLAGAWRRSASSRSAASSSTTCRPTGSTTCPTAASRTPASAARACAGRSRT